MLHRAFETPVVFIALAAPLSPAPSEALRGLGYRIIETQRPEECVTLFQEYRPDLTLLDWRLPNCADICRALRGIGGDMVPILIMIEYTYATLDQVLQAGATDFVGLPLYLPALRQRARHLLQSFRISINATLQAVYAEALARTSALLTSTLDLNEVLDRILATVGEVVPSDGASIVLVEDGVGRIARWRGYERHATRAEIEAVRFVIEETQSLRDMTHTGQVILIHNVEHYHGWITQQPTAWIKSHIAAPIRVGSQTIGFLHLDGATPYQFQPEDANRLQAFADQAGIAIANARQYGRARQQTVVLAQQVEEQIQALDIERGQLRPILDLILEGVIYSEIEEHWLSPRYINRALSRMTGFSWNEWQTGGWVRCYQRPHESDADFRAMIADFIDAVISKGSWQSEVQLNHKDGSVIAAYETSSVVMDTEGLPVGVVSVIRNISAEKALSAQRSHFVAHASHELRTPLTNFKTRLYLLRRRPEQLQEHLRVLEEVADRMQRLIEDLLSVSRLENGVIRLEPENVVIQKVIQGCIALQTFEAERKHQRIVMDLAPEPLHVFADAERLNQVITNLITNAINYTPDNGMIIVRALRQPETVLVEVEDTGIGIAPEDMSNIFQPFYRVFSKQAASGTGLGLSIAQEIVRLHGGEITVRSQVGQGSCFCFHLPLIQDGFQAV